MAENDKWVIFHPLACYYLLFLMFCLIVQKWHPIAIDYSAVVDKRLFLSDPEYISSLLWSLYNLLRRLCFISGVGVLRGCWPGIRVCMPYLTGIGIIMAHIYATIKSLVPRKLSRNHQRLILMLQLEDCHYESSIVPHVWQMYCAYHIWLFCGSVLPSLCLIWKYH